MTFDLKQHVLDVDGEPVPDKSTQTIFRQPMDVQVKATGETFEGVSALLSAKKTLTYQKAIQSALRQAGNDDDKAFDKDDCGNLRFKLVADTDVELNIDERNLARDACKKFSDTDVYIRVRNLLFPEDQEPKEGNKKGGKK